MLWKKNLLTKKLRRPKRRKSTENSISELPHRPCDCQEQRTSQLPLELDQLGDDSASVRSDIDVKVNDKETTIAPPVSVKKEESNKREITRDGEKEERNKKIRKTDSKENIPLSVEKKQAPKPPATGETNERRLSREKGPAPPPPPLPRQDSKNDEKENVPKIEITDRPKSAAIDDNKQQIKNVSMQNHNKEDSSNLNGESQKSIEKNISMDNLEKIKSPKVEENARSPEKKNVDIRPKSAEGKRHSGSKKQMSIEEKRKSAPVRPVSSDEWKKPVLNKQCSLEEKNRLERKPSIENIKSIQEKRRSVEEKLNAVLERQISMEVGKRINDSIAENAKQPPKTRNSTFSEKSSVKASSTGDIKKNSEIREDLEKCRSEGSSRNDSYENVSKPSRESPPGQRTRDRRASGSAVNVAVITSTPNRSKSISRCGSGDNIVVITGKSAIDQEMRLNTSTVRITTETPDPSNSLASNVSQVTVVTTHPPVLVDASSTPPPRHSSPTSEVVIVANETNKTQVNESSTDDDGFPSLDSLEYTPQEQSIVITDASKKIGKKLDESEVIIVSPIVDELQDTSHVSVVTVGDEQEQVKDSSVIGKCNVVRTGSSLSDISSTERSSDSGDETSKTSMIIASSKVDTTEVDDAGRKAPIKMNGQLKNNQPSHVNRIPKIQKQSETNLKTQQKEKRVSPDSYEGSRSHSDSGSTRSYTPSKSVDRSDAESISTTISQDSRGSNKENHIGRESRQSSEIDDEVVLRRKPEYNRDVPRTTRTKEDIQMMNLKKKTRKRTRKFEIDGVVVTTTTSRVIYGDDENGKVYDDQIFRKQELRELKMLQKMEQKQFQDLSQKAQCNKDHQEKRFEQERQLLERGAEADLEMLARQQRQQIERAETQQEADLRLASKKIRSEQERELKQFREGLKQDLRLIKQEVDLMPKEKRKNAFKVRKEKLESEHEDREKLFLEKLNENHEMSLRRLSDSHREKIALMERQFLQQKQQLMRAREAAIWELEERQIHERQQLLKRQLKDIFFLQRHQMLIRHEKELEQMKRMNLRKEEELIKRQTIERRNLPKRIRNEMKAREMMFRESMRISITSTTPDPDAERDKLKKFQENEKKRYRAEQQRFELKHSRQLEEVKAQCDANIKELEQLQNEKRKMLMEHETMKLKEQEEAYTKELREWKTLLKPRKQKLEAELTTEMEALETRYRGYLPSRLSGFYLTTFDYSTLSLPGTLKRSTKIPHNSTPNSPSSFSIPRVSLKTSGSDTSSLSSTLSRRYSKSDLVPYSFPRN
ncbi:serine/threonine-protein kinase 10-like isoform X3 [Leptopilina boulardi]|uniref:serine/threonine-protein kinase 10-like isoform X3 n=1 Tax=Leptopilina boulardi TaxID=63433 RepID=UPI0021F69981|nr:serine/threonine-protein kinase 10-like isoform X3 [Leptopilina boulardi]